MKINRNTTNSQCQVCKKCCSPHSDNFLNDSNCCPPHLQFTVEMVFSLEAGDEFLRQRVMNLPEKTVAGTHYTEEGVYQSVGRRSM